MGGVLPFTRVNPYTGIQEKNDGWVLISQEKGGPDKKTWDALSGKKDPGETGEDTAAREGSEECCETIGTMEEIRAKMFRLGKSKATYVMEIADPKTCDDAAFQIQRKKPKYRNKKCCQEKIQFQWVRVSDIVDACVNKNNVLAPSKEETDPNKLKSMVIRPYLASTIRKNQKFFQEHFHLVQKHHHAVKHAPVGGNPSIRPKPPTGGKQPIHAKTKIQPMPETPAPVAPTFVAPVPVAAVQPSVLPAATLTPSIAMPAPTPLPTPTEAPLPTPTPTVVPVSVPLPVRAAAAQEPKRPVAAKMKPHAKRAPKAPARSFMQDLVVGFKKAMHAISSFMQKLAFWK